MTQECAPSGHGWWELYRLPWSVTGAHLLAGKVVRCLWCGQRATRAEAKEFRRSMDRW